VDTELVLEIRGLGKSYGQTRALDRVSLDVRRGELVTLLGPSGSGKTTLLKVVAGFETPDEGVVRLRGTDISPLPPARRGIGMVFQHYALFPHMTVAQNIGYGLKLRRKPHAERERRVAEMLELLRLQGLQGRYPRQLSGGQQQRVALGRALAYDPQLILMDEPLGALDRALRIEMEQEIRALRHQLGATILYVTHDQQEALALSDRIAIMCEGQIVGMDSPARLHDRPPSGFVARFFSGANLLPAELVERLDGELVRVRCLGSEIVCHAEPGLLAGAQQAPGRQQALGGQLAVRPRSWRRDRVDGGLTIAGVAVELTLLGDEQQLALEVEDLGRILAVLPTRDCSDVGLGVPIALHADASETTLVSS
jgi:ABC-type Fe3+/spermidine/putrescine transport system ATPase subunit